MVFMTLHIFKGHQNKREGLKCRSRDAYEQLFTDLESSFNRNEEITLDIIKEVYEII